MKRISISILALVSSLSHAELFSFSVFGMSWVYDCGLNGVVRYTYVISEPSILQPVISERMKYTDSLEMKCQPLSDDGYAMHQKTNQPRYDTVSVLPWVQPPILTTIAIPMHSQLTASDGAWTRILQLESCASHSERILVAGGVVWDQRPSDDYFFQSHNIPTPDFFWKIIYGEETKSYRAFLFPNTREGLAEDLFSRFEYSYDRIRELMQRRAPDIRGILDNPEIVNEGAFLQCLDV